MSEVKEDREDAIDGGGEPLAVPDLSITITNTDDGRGPTPAAGPAPDLNLPDVTMTADPVSPKVPGLGSRTSLPLLEVPLENYEIIGEQGRGGIGVVRRARDLRLDRNVAIKELQRDSGQARLRFEREMRITAKLQHPGVVPVHEAGRWPDGSPFYAMKLVDGRSLKALIAEKRTLEERLALLPSVLAVAETIAYAHSQRIVHRDLKPSNVIVGDFGETVVIDWGLAKDLDDPAGAPDVEGGPYRIAPEEGLTVAGQVMGTPAYMPPEQARGADVDERADVYSIGAVLYHVLAGAPPYAGHDSAEVLARVVSTAPSSIEGLVPEVPRDLAAIVAKAMERDTAARYSNARTLADDLARFQTGQLVSAHHYSTATILRRWVLKHKNAVGVAAALLIVLAATSLLSVRRIVHERYLATRAQETAETRANDLLLVQAQSQLTQDPTAALEWVSKYAAKGADMSRARDIAADAVSRGVARYVLHGHHRNITGFAFGRDSQLFAASGDSLLFSWEFRQERHVIARQIFDASKVASAKEAARLAFEDGLGNVLVADYHGKIEARLPGHSGAIIEMKFSPDGRWLTTADWQSVTRLWHLANEGTLVWERRDLLATSFYAKDRLLVATRSGRNSDRSSFAMEDLGGVNSISDVLSSDVPGTVVTLAATIDGNAVAYGTLDGLIGMIDVRRKSARELGSVDAIANIAISKDGQFVAAGSRRGSAKLWDAREGSVLADYRHEAPIISVAFTSHRLITAGEEGKITITDADGGAVVHLNAGAPIVIPVTVSRDDHWLAVAAADDIRIWDLTSIQPRRATLHKIGTFNTLFSDDRTVISDGTDGRVIAWDIPSGAKTVLAEHTDLVFGLSASADRDTIGWASHDGTAGIRSLSTQQGRVLRGHQGSVMGIAVAPTGRIVATAGADKTVKLWTNQGELLKTFEGFADQVYRVKFSSDGQRLSAISRDGRIRVVNMTTMVSDDFASPVGHAVTHGWLPGTHMIIIGTDLGMVALWSPESGAIRPIFKHDGLVTAVTASSAGSWIASAGKDGVIAVTNQAFGQSWLFHTLGTWPTNVIITPDASMAVVTCRDGTVRLWTLNDGSASVLRSGDKTAFVSSLSPNGDVLSTTVDAGAVTAWDLTKVQFVPLDASAFRNWLALSSASFDSSTFNPFSL